MFLKFSVALIFYCSIAVKSVVNGAKPDIDQLQCDCGIANERTPKIIGGTEVTPYKYPWMVSVTTGNSSVTCGGALITRQYVLTAATCLQNRSNISVGIAVHDLSNPGQLIPASITKIYPNFTLETGDNNVGLIKLAKAVEISERVRTLCLPHNLDLEQPGRKAIVAGWGLTQLTEDPKNNRSQVLKEINVKIEKTDTVITARGKNGTGACYGDGGSPLFTRYKDGKFHVIGVTSAGKGYSCLESSIYARVSPLKRWIMKNIKDSVRCEKAGKQTTPIAPK